jgi:oxygen-dependent protoporphyrinogen oxidase
MSSTTDVIVVGAGIAGLAVAYDLSARGLRVRLLDRASRPGGVVLTEQIDGFTIDAGPDALLIQKPAAIALCRELGLGDRLFPTKLPRMAYIQRGGRLYPLPEASILGIPTKLMPLVTTGLFTWLGKVRMGLETVVARRTAGDDESIGGFMRRRFGPEAVDYLAEPLLAGIPAGDVERLSMRALFPRFLDAEQKHGSLIRSFRRMRAGAHGGGDGAFMSLPGGLEELVRAIVAALPPGTLSLGEAVVSVEGGAPYIVTTAGGQRLEAPVVAVCTPAYIAADLLKPADADLAALCGQVQYASTATVALGYRREQIAHPLNGSGFVIPRVEKTTLMAASWVSSKWPMRAPEGFALLRGFIGGARDPHALDADDAQLIGHAKQELGTLLGIVGEPVLTRLYRWHRASAQHEVGHLDRMAAIDRVLARHPGLYVTGSGFRGAGLPDCIADGRATARQIATLVAGRSATG